MSLQSVWFDDVERPNRPVLSGDLDVDLVVVGAGITGLTTALLAQRDGLSVAVVEARRVGSGTTGHTTGKLTAQHGLVYAGLAERHGIEAARTYASANSAGVSRVARLVDEFDISCELTTALSCVYSQEPERRADLAAEAKVAASLGFPAVLIDATDLPFDVDAAVQFADQLHLHPMRYLTGLAEAFVDADGQLFEHTRVVDLAERDDEVVVSTATGTIRANDVVVATLLPFGLIGGYFAKTRPSRSFGIAVRLSDVAPLSMTLSVDAPTRSTRPWPGGGPTGLIVAGGSHPTGDDQDTSDLLDELVDWTRRTFSVAHVDHQWSAQDYATPDHVPYVGRASTHQHILVATGFAKWGLSAGTAAAIMLTDHLADRDNPWASLFDAGRIGDLHAVGTLVGDNLKVGKDFIAGRFARVRDADPNDLRPGQGALVRLRGDVVGAYRTESGELRLVEAKCSHLGCPLRWNTAEHSWDCSCHGSRFDTDGTILAGPATSGLTIVDSTESGAG